MKIDGARVLALALVLGSLIVPASAKCENINGGDYGEPFGKKSQDAIVAMVSVMLVLIVIAGLAGTTPETAESDLRKLLGLQQEEAVIATPGMGTPVGSSLDLAKMGDGTPDEAAEAAPGKQLTKAEFYKAWFRKYFLEGQMLNEQAVKQEEEIDESVSPVMRFLLTHRKTLSMVLPAMFFHSVWWPIMIGGNYFIYFKKKWNMSITMIFGSMFAGCTSEGGAAIAFPVLTLVFDVCPIIARDFSFMIQAQGMTAAAFTIFFMKVKIEYASIFYCTLSGILGMYVGLEEIAPRMDPPVKKIMFVCIWASFASSLYLLNREKGRQTFVGIPDFKPWKALVLLICGFVGGVFSAIAGSGIDICSFAVLTLLFRVTEKTATPTSVVLMGINTCAGFFIREFHQGGVHPESWKFLMVCMPIVVFGAPFGSYIGSHLHRLVLAWLVYIIDAIQLIGAFAILKHNGKFDNPDFEWLQWGGPLVLVGGVCVFVAMTKAGDLMMARYIEQGKAANSANPLASGA